MRAIKVAALDRIAPASLGPLKFEKDPLNFSRGYQGPFQLILMGNTV